ncbi:MAG: host specificity protein J, partial [Candidatus Fonsibacter ubiquis]
MNAISGSGGSMGGGKGGGNAKAYTPTEAKDNLESKQYAQLIDLISEGEIEGLVDGAKSIFLDGTPLQNADGTYNFQNVTAYARNGTQSQDYIPLQFGSANTKPVSVTVKQAIPIVRTITNAAVDAVRVTVSVPQLQSFSDKGDINGEAAHVVIYVQYNGGGYTMVVSDVIRGRTADLYQRDYLIDLNGAFPVDIKVGRFNPDSNSAKVSNDFSWASYTEITYEKLRYPNSALVAFRIDAEQFSRIPERSYLIRGIKVKIPSNATVDSSTGRLIYAGIWNGTLGAAQWTTDPAWILFDLLTNTRFGFGDHISDSQLDKWAFYACSVYSSALVPNGKGGYEPRFSCNVNIQTAEDAYKLIGDMCSVFRAMPYWSTGALTVAQDAPSDPAYIFTLANVTEAGFSYSNGSLKNKPTVAVVSYLDLELKDIAKEAVEDATLIKKYGVTTAEISAFACTSRSQARRMGRWLLYSEWYESEVCSFTASIDAGVLVRPGQIIAVADPVRAGARRGGRISSATTTTVTADDVTGLSVDASSTLTVILPDGTAQTRAVSKLVGNVFTVSAPFSSAPNANSMWVYETSNIQTSLWRVLSVEEQDGIEYAISALAHDPGKYAYIEQDIPLVPRDTTDLNIIPSAPANLTGNELLYEGTGGVKSKIVLTWQAASNAVQYRIRWRSENGNWFSDTQASPDYEILDTTAGTYQIEVYSLSAGMVSSTLASQLTFNAFGKTAPPADVTGLSLVAVDSSSAILSWDRAVDLDVLVGGKVLIRHSQSLTLAEWDASQEIVAAAAGSQTQKLVPLLKGTYLVKFEDDTGNRSVNATLVVADLPTPQPRLLVHTYAEDAESPPFNGNSTNMTYQYDLDGLIITSGIAVDDMATDGNWDALTAIDGIGGVLPSGEHEFGSTFDMGAVFDVNIQRRLVTGPYLPNATWDDRAGVIDTWPAIDETDLDRTDARVYARSTVSNLSDPNITPVWSEWREFANAIMRGRGFQFKMIATTTSPDINILVSELGAVLELQQRTEQSAVLTSGGGSYGVVFAEAFYQTPAVGITAMNMATGDYFTISATSRQGFTLTFRDSTGAAVSRQFTYTA